MAERRSARGSSGGRTSTRRRKPSDREVPGEEPEAPDEAELPEEADDELADGEEPEEPDDELADGEPDDELADDDEPEEADEKAAGNGRRRPARRGGSSMTAGEAAKAALRQIAQLTEKRPEGVTGVERTDDGWTIGIELVEDQRIPSSADILASYEATIDADGELVSYRRVRRYARGRADSEEP